jgi:hypothetical protein
MDAQLQQIIELQTKQNQLLESAIAQDFRTAAGIR